MPKATNLFLTFHFENLRSIYTNSISSTGMSCRIQKIISIRIMVFNQADLRDINIINAKNVRKIIKVMKKSDRGASARACNKVIGGKSMAPITKYSKGSSLWSISDSIKFMFLSKVNNHA